MTGKDYVAKTTIWNAKNEVVADIGQTCERVAPESLGWLLAGGHIAPGAGPAPIRMSTPLIDEIHEHSTRAVFDALKSAAEPSAETLDGEGGDE